MLKKIKGLIDKAKYISFDIFDTAILRMVHEPTYVFYLIESEYQNVTGKAFSDFKNIRKMSEKRARNNIWERSGKTEVTLEQIYQVMQDEFNISSEVVDNLKKIEAEIENKICIRNEVIYSIYNYCLEQKKIIIFTSDMYLSLSVITKLLRDNGYKKYHKIFLSSEIGLTKASGELYGYILQQLSCIPQEVLHIGDSYNSDIEKSKKFGIPSVYYPKFDDLSERIEIFKGKGITIEESIYRALIINKYYHCTSSNRYLSSGDFWYDFGYKYIGVLFLGYIKWLHEQFIKDKIKKVFFLSRDGYIMKKVYDILGGISESSPPSQYLYASRRALNIPSIQYIDDNTLDFLVSGSSTLMVSQFLERMKLNPDDFTQEIKQAGFAGAHNKVVTGKDYAMLRELYFLIADDIKKIAGIERTILLKYFNQAGVFECDNIAVVDIGWHGSLQGSLRRLIDKNKKINIKGYYFGTFSKARKLSDDGCSMEGYLCHFGEPSEYYDLIRTSVELFEFIYTAPHGSVINFEEENEVVKPIFDMNDCESTKIDKASRVHQGALDFIQDMIKFNQKFPLFEISKEWAVKPLSRVLLKPTIEEATYLGDLEHAEWFGDGYAKCYIAKPSSLFGLILNPIRFYYDYRKSFWKRGFIKRSGFIGGYLIRLFDYITHKMNNNAILSPYYNKLVCMVKNIARNI